MQTLEHRTNQADLCWCHPDVLPAGDPDSSAKIFVRREFTLSLYDFSFLRFLQKQAHDMASGNLNDDDVKMLHGIEEICKRFAVLLEHRSCYPKGLS